MCKACEDGSGYTISTTCMETLEVTIKPKHWKKLAQAWPFIEHISCRYQKLRTIALAPSVSDLQKELAAIRANTIALENNLNALTVTSKAAIAACEDTNLRLLQEQLSRLRCAITEVQGKATDGKIFTEESLPDLIPELRNLDVARDKAKMKQKDGRIKKKDGRKPEAFSAIFWGLPIALMLYICHVKPSSTRDGTFALIITELLRDMNRGSGGAEDDYPGIIPKTIKMFSKFRSWQLSLFDPPESNEDKREFIGCLFNSMNHMVDEVERTIFPPPPKCRMNRKLLGIFNRRIPPPHRL